jgi:hypothetical protein
MIHSYNLLPLPLLLTEEINKNKDKNLNNKKNQGEK